MKKAKLIIDNKEVAVGIGVGVSGVYAGELVFNTAMSGYPEAITDPSYSDQILLFSYPLIGNYGISSKWFESKKFQPKAIICGEISQHHDHFEDTVGLDKFMENQNVGGITGVDTRFLVKLIRKQGAMEVVIIVE